MKKSLPTFLLAAGAISLTLVAAVFLLASRGKESKPYSTSGANLDKFQTVVSYLNDNYFKEVDNQKLIDDAIKGMLNGLDPHTIYLSAAEMREAQELLGGSFDGIGVEFNIVEDTIYVVQSLVGGPSEKLGIRAGDRIVKINDKTVAGIGVTNNDVFKSLRGKKGTTVTIAIKRQGQPGLMSFDITRDKIPVNSVEYSYMVNKTTGYIKIDRFGENTFREFHEHLAKLKTEGLQNLILDLRENGGGYMNPAQQIADEFLSEGKLVVYTQGRNPEANSRYEATSLYNSFEKGGLIILIDEGTASASEIVSGAVQDNDRGLIIGIRSYGKGLVQSQKDLGDGSAVRIVVSRYFTPSGRCIQKPYENETQDEYNQEITKRFKSGEIYDPTKINFPDSLKYKTHSGRTVYGGGAIMPDVFIPYDTSASTPYIFGLISKQVTTRYAYKFVERNPEVKNTYKNGLEYSEKFKVTEAMLNELTAAGAKEGVPFVEKQYNISRRVIENRLKAQIGHILYGDEGTRPVYNEIDVQFQEALRLMPAAIELERSGKFSLTDKELANIKSAVVSATHGEQAKN